MAGLLLGERQALAAALALAWQCTLTRSYSRKRPQPEAMGGADVALMQLIVDQSPYLFLDEIRD